MIRVKICGVTTPADAAFAADCGADAVGLNFYPKSPRFLTRDQTEAILRELPPFTTAVGVFVDVPLNRILDISIVADEFHLRTIQTHFSSRPPVTFLKLAHVPAFRVKDAESLDFVRQFVATSAESGRAPAAVLLDSYVEGEFGGTGRRAPWDLLAGFDPGVPVILAGGLTPDNVADAIRIVRPWGVDVASGVESSPGQKDPGKVRAFIQAAKACAT